MAKSTKKSKIEKKIVAKKSKVSRRTFGEGRIEWYNGIVDRLVKRMNSNISKLEKELSKVKSDKNAVKSLSEIKGSISTAINNLKKA